MLHRRKYDTWIKKFSIDVIPRKKKEKEEKI